MVEKHPLVERLLNLGWAGASEKVSYYVPGSRLVLMAVCWIYRPERPTTVSWPSLWMKLISWGCREGLEWQVLH